MEWAESARLANLYHNAPWKGKIANPMPADREPVTTLLLNWRAGKTEAAEKLVMAVYDELRRLAAHYLRDERPDHTLQPTALVNEMFVRLFESEPVNWQNRAHFFAVAAQQLRRILVNHARDRQAQKRGGKQMRVELADEAGALHPREHDLLELDDALNRLEQVDARAARVIELRFFAGLTEAEIAEALGISISSMKRDWSFGRAWLLSRLSS
ncbi:MAG TPA: sigma-70 family RNA polymerase sigma factor [Bryobacteraceae bacterium]|nr:sigma-70 family RNA polymerase sigma factor [Bryobacteraceae bacterium]